MRAACPHARALPGLRRSLPALRAGLPGAPGRPEMGRGRRSGLLSGQERLAEVVGETQVLLVRFEVVVLTACCVTAEHPGDGEHMAGSGLGRDRTAAVTAAVTRL